MRTLQETIKEYREGNKEIAYQLYLQDEGSMDISYSLFCEKFKNVIRADDDRIAEEQAMSRFSWGE